MVNILSANEILSFFNSNSFVYEHMFITFVPGISNIIQPVGLLPDKDINLG